MQVIYQVCILRSDYIKKLYMGANVILDKMKKLELEHAASQAACTSGWGGVTRTKVVLIEKQQKYI